jgi:hypothetical protein
MTLKSEGLVGGVWDGVKAAIIASSCCSFPVALVYAFTVLGAGSVSAALKIPKYKWFFLAAGTAFILISMYFRIRKLSGGTCSLGDVARERNLIIVTLATYAVLTMFVIYLLLPVVSQWLFS